MLPATPEKNELYVAYRLRLVPDGVILPAQLEALGANAPVSHQELEQAASFWRLLGRQPKRNALVELTNALAAAPTVKEVSSADVDRIGATYGVDVRSEFAEEFGELYDAALRHTGSAPRPPGISARPSPRNIESRPVNPRTRGSCATSLR